MSREAPLTSGPGSIRARGHAAEWSCYLERAEHTARLIDVDFQLRLDQSPEAGSGRWWRLLEALQAPPPEDGKIDATTLTHILTPLPKVRVSTRRSFRVASDAANSG